MNIAELGAYREVHECEVSRMEDETTYVKVLGLAAKVCQRTGIKLSQAIYELSASLQGGSPYLTFVGRYKGEVVGYLCGRLNGGSFFILQALSSRPRLTRVIWDSIRAQVESLGVVQYELLTPHNVRVFTRYGFKFERHYMTMKVGG